MGMETNEQIRQDIIKDVNGRLRSEPSIEEIIRRIERNIESGLGAGEYSRDGFFARLRRALNKKARKEYENRKKLYEARKVDAINSYEHIKDMREYKAFLESVRDAASSGTQLEDVYKIIDDYEEKGMQHRTGGLKALNPQFLEQRIRSEYLDMPIEQVPVLPSHRQDSLGYLKSACRRHPDISQSKLVEQVFERLKGLYQYVCRSSAENGCRPIVALYPSCGTYQTADEAVSSALREIAEVRGMKSPEIEALMSELSGDVDLSKIDKGMIRLQVVK